MRDPWISYDAWAAPAPPDPDPSWEAANDDSPLPYAGWGSFVCDGRPESHLPDCEEPCGCLDRCEWWPAGTRGDMWWDRETGRTLCRDCASARADALGEWLLDPESFRGTEEDW